MFTQHGHHIPGTNGDQMYPPSTAKCGGLIDCKDCQLEASQHQNEGMQMLPVDLQELAKKILTEHLREQFASEGRMPVFTTYVVWFSKALQNWKAQLATDLPDGKFYEITHNGDAHETYIDEYVKVSNTVIPDTATG